MKLFFAFILLFGSAANATKGVSNGGAGVDCRAVGGTITLWDFEYGTTQGFTYNWLESLKMDSEDRVIAVIERLAKVDPVRAKLYMEWLNKTTVILDDRKSFYDVTDDVPMPRKGCKKVPLAYQVRALCGDTLVNARTASILVAWKESWEHLTMGHKTGLILHELVYHETAHRGLFRAKEDKPFVPYRIAYFAALLASDQFPDSIEQYKKLEKKAMMPPMTSLSEKPRCDYAKED